MNSKLQVTFVEPSIAIARRNERTTRKNLLDALRRGAACIAIWLSLVGTLDAQSVMTRSYDNSRTGANTAGCRRFNKKSRRHMEFTCHILSSLRFEKVTQSHLMLFWRVSYVGCFAQLLTNTQFWFDFERLAY
jgi:hypothetical protein